jgi:hypothetical protein
MEWYVDRVQVPKGPLRPSQLVWWWWLIVALPLPQRVIRHLVTGWTARQL